MIKILRDSIRSVMIEQFALSLGSACPNVADFVVVITPEQSFRLTQGLLDPCSEQFYDAVEAVINESKLDVPMWLICQPGAAGASAS